MPGLFIFDFDGTLADTITGIVRSVNAGLADFGQPPKTQNEVRDNMGRGLRNLCLWAGKELPEDRRHELADRIMVHQRLLWRSHMRVFPGIPQVLQRLRADGLKIAVFSNKLNDFAIEVAHGSFPPGTFDLVAGISDLTPAKPAPDSLLHIASTLGVAPEDTIMVGDMWVDIAAGQAAGMRTIGVTWGYHGEDGFKDQVPWRLARTAEDILTIYEQTKS